MKTGAELGVKAGRSYFYYLKRNPQLSMLGLDLWISEPNGPYKKNPENEAKALKKNRPFNNRSILYKGDAVDIANKVADKSLDFVFYDLYNYRVSIIELHKKVLEAWLPKIRVGGYLIGRDFHEPHIHEAIRLVTSDPISAMEINGKPHIRLKLVKATS